MDLPKEQKQGFVGCFGFFVIYFGIFVLGKSLTGSGLMAFMMANAALFFLYTIYLLTYDR